MIYFIYCLSRIIFYPCILGLALFSSKVKKRLKFEGQQKIGFDINKHKADFCFEVSSEGELEQVYYIIEKILLKGLSIEIIYCSESVEKSCLNLFSLYPTQINLLSLPVLSFFPGHKINDPNQWISSDQLIFCRYDFFPELIHFSKTKGKMIKLISGSLNRFEHKNFLNKLYLKNCYKQFQTIVAASKNDEEKFIELLGQNRILEKTQLPIQISHFDFRIPRILTRVSKAEEVLKKKFPFFDHFCENVLSKRYKKRRIFGSFWPYEAKMFENTLGEYKYLVCIAPHNVDGKSVQKIVESLGTMDTYIIYDGMSEKEYFDSFHRFSQNNGIWIFQIKGVLCELYSYFDQAYIGGGFGASVHSLLEPYLSGCQVVCGPKVQRSSEYLWIKENAANSIRITNRMENTWDELNALPKSLLRKKSEYIISNHQNASEYGLILNDLIGDKHA